MTSSGTGVPSSYTTRLDGAAARSVASNGSVAYESLAAGNYEVALSVPSNCTVSGSATRTIGVQEGSTSPVAYSVTCSATPTGAIGVTTSTTGSPIDPDGYSITVGGNAAGTIGANGTRLVPDLPVGTHEVELGGVADNCMVQGDNPRDVMVTQNQTTQVRFDVVCSATTGLIEVTVTTTGSEPDPDGYVVDLDGAATQSVDVNGTTTFTGVEQGDHVITLQDLAPNCTVTTTNPVDADVTAGQTTDVAFSVSCEATTGSLSVNASTSGSEIDPNGYAVSVDGGPVQALSVNDGTTFTGLAPGAHQVELSGVSANCAVSGANPRSVDVTAGATASTTFNVTCSSTVGSIEVTVSTTGDAIDPDGYTVVLDGGAASQPVDPDDTATFGGLAPGGHTVQLTNVADNCSVTSANPQSPTVTAGATTDVTFDVECEALTGSIQVNASTTGSSLDPDGYTVLLDGGTPRSLSINGSRTYSSVVIGDHDIELTGVASNCAVGGDNPRTVTVTEGATTVVDFDVGCSATTGQIQVTVTTTGDELDPNGYTVNLDGTSSRAVATNGSTTFTGIAPGAHTLTLENLAANCSTTSPNPVGTSVTAGATANVAFTVDCDRTVGDIRVFASSSGTPVDMNGYTVTVDGGNAQSLTINGDVLFTDLAPGNHVVEISDIDAQCALTGTATRNVNVIADAESDVTYVITCAPLTGDIQVTVSTSGLELDPDGYTVLLDGGGGQAVATNGSTTFVDVDTGGHSLTLTGIASNCSVTGVNPVFTTVVANTTADVDFAVSCAATTGTIDVDVTTTGPEPDPDGYTVTLDGGSGQAVGVNGSVSFTSVTPGLRDVGLTGLASNCVPSEPNPTTVSVTAGATSDVSFTVTCSATTGALRVTANTTGEDQDDSYSLTLAGTGIGTIDANGDTATVSPLAPGDYEVILGDVAGNCSVGGAGAIDTVTVTAGATTTKAFDVACVGLTGAIEVTTTTTGEDLDPDGYEIVVDGGAPVAIGTNATVTIDGLDDGSRTVELTGEAANCTIGGSNPRSVVVAPNDTTPTAFAITCTSTTGDLRVTAVTSGSDLDTGYTVSVNGGGAQALGANGDTVTVADLAPGDHEVALGDVAANCAVSGGAIDTVAVAAGVAALRSFAVTCDPLTGSIEVRTSTTGATMDADGYQADVDGGASMAIAATDTVTFTAVPVGTRTVNLTDVEDGCAVSGSASVDVAVTFGGTATADFDVVCP